MAGRFSDERLVARYRGGDEHAFAEVDARYRAPLERFARRMLPASPAIAEDVVQEALLRASRALLRDDRHIDLRPWLFRLTRNCALDEIARLRTSAVPLDDPQVSLEVVGSPALQPEEAIERRQSIADVLADLAALPEPQRHALVRRELDGLTHEQLALELGTTQQATKSLVFRARTNLMRERDARSLDCLGVRADLLAAADARRRAPRGALRHVAHCRPCREFRRDLKAQATVIALLTPGPLVLIGLAGAKLGGGLVATKKAAMAGTASVVTVGAVGLGTHVAGPGDPSPVPVRSRAVEGGLLARGTPLPAGTAVVRQLVSLRPGAFSRREVRMRCPRGTRVADLLAPEGAPIGVGYAPGTTVGASRLARLRFMPAQLDQPAWVTLTMLCKRPTVSGTLLAPDARAATPPTHRVTRAEELVRSGPGGPVRAALHRGQPVAVTGASGGWRRVIADDRTTGWARAIALERLP